MTPYFPMLLLNLAEAVPVVDTSAIEDLKRSGFESHDTGWFGLSAEWAQRIYIGDTEAEVSQWFIRMQTQYYKQKLQPVEGDWDEGLGSDEFLMVRLNNIGLFCQGNNPTLCISHLKSRIVNIELESECNTPAAQLTTNNLWRLNTHCKYIFTGGQPVYQDQADEILFTTLPNTIVVYNQYAQSWRYELTDQTSYVLKEPHKASVRTIESQSQN